MLLTISSHHNDDNDGNMDPATRAGKSGTSPHFTDKETEACGMHFLRVRPHRQGQALLGTMQGSGESP